MENRLRKDPLAKEQDPAQLRKEIAAKEEKIFKELGPAARERFDQQAAGASLTFLGNSPHNILVLMQAAMFQELAACGNHVILHPAHCQSAHDMATVFVVTQEDCRCI